jgi:hypothetical protein
MIKEAYAVRRTVPPSAEKSGTAPMRSSVGCYTVAAVGYAGGRCAFCPDQLAAQSQARAVMQPVDRGLGAVWVTSCGLP